MSSKESSTDVKIDSCASKSAVGVGMTTVTFLPNEDEVPAGLGSFRKLAPLANEAFGVALVVFKLLSEGIPVPLRRIFGAAAGCVDMVLLRARVDFLVGAAVVEAAGCVDMVLLRARVDFLAGAAVVEAAGCVLLRARVDFLVGTVDMVLLRESEPIGFTGTAATTGATVFFDSPTARYVSCGASTCTCTIAGVEGSGGAIGVVGADSPGGGATAGITSGAGVRAAGEAEPMVPLRETGAFLATGRGEPVRELVCELSGRLAYPRLPPLVLRVAVRRNGEATGERAVAVAEAARLGETAVLGDTALALGGVEERFFSLVDPNSALHCSCSELFAAVICTNW